MQINRRSYSILLSLVAAWCGGILVAPALSFSHPDAASLLYSFYAPICHQIDARSFHLFGAKFAVCIRCSSIYFSFLLSLAAYPFIRRLSSPALPGRSWLVLAIAPMVFDVLLTLTGVHPSTELTRAVSGALFGMILPFYLIPPLLEGIAQLRGQFLARGGFFYARKAE